MMSKMMQMRNKILKKISYENYRKRNNNWDFTLISQNCIGGVIYHMLGMEFKSPTINMFIEDENFVKLVENLPYYLSLQAVAKEECFVDPLDDSVHYPKIAIGDIEICCLHYVGCDEAIDAWERRKRKVNLENVYVIGNSWNMHGRDDFVKRVLKSGYKTVVFTKEFYPYDGCIKLPGEFWKLDKRGIVRPNITDFITDSYQRYFENFFDFVSWLN